jgi:flagellar protein FliL
MATQKEPVGEKSGIKGLVLAALATCLLGLPLGYFLFDFVAPQKKEKPVAAPAASSENPEQNTSQGEGSTETTEEVVKGPFTIVPLPPIITNIAEPQKVWVRLEGSLVFDKANEQNPAVMSAKLAQHVMAYLRTLKLTDMQGAGAVHALTQDLDEIVRTLSDGQVQALLLSGLVFE